MTNEVGAIARAGAAPARSAAITSKFLRSPAISGANLPDNPAVASILESLLPLALNSSVDTSSPLQ